MLARCCWCRRPFVLHNGAYWCPTERCRTRQAAHAIAFTDPRTGAAIPFYVPLPKQVEFDGAPKRFLLGGGAAGASKSHGGRFSLYRRALAIPGFDGLILRKTWNELEKHHLRLMEREARRLQQLGRHVEYLRSARELRIYHPEGEISTIEGGHMEHEEDIDKYLSRERDAILADEGTLLDPDVLLQLSTRARSTKPQVAAFARALWHLPATVADRDIPGGGAVFWVLSNPGGPAAAVCRDLFIDHLPDLVKYPQLGERDSEGRPLYDQTEWGYIPGNLEDNPYLPASYERDLAVLPAWRYQQLRYNNWDIIVGQFFTEFNAALHVHDLGTPVHYRWFRSYDYGYIDPGVCFWWVVLPDHRLYIRHEFQHQFLRIEDICREIRQQTRDLGSPTVSYTVADAFSMGMRGSDDGEPRGETFGYHGVPVTDATHDRENGWTRCRELLGTRPDGLPWLIIHPSCRRLIRALGGAISAKSRPEDIDEHFEGRHALDSFRYGAMSRPAPSRLRPPVLGPRTAGYHLQQLRAGSTEKPFAFR